MPAIQIFGKMGSNKTHFATYYALLLANKYKKKIVANYLFHPDNLMQYCQNMGYSWLVENLSKPEPLIYYCDIENGGMDNILSLQDSIVLFDEIALYVPARGSGSVTTKTSKFHKDLTQIRHRFIYLIAIAQNHQQIDSAIKNLSEETFHCDGITFHDEKLGTKKLYYKIVNRFIPDNYEIWVANPRLRRNPIKTKIMSTKSFSGLLTTADVDLFGVYPSFGLVHQVNIADTFPDSFGTYYKEPLSKNSTFSWAYILPLPQAVCKSKLRTWAYSKLPYQYLIVASDIFSLYLKYANIKSFVLYQPSSNKNLNLFVLCLLSLAGFLLVLYISKYGLFFLFALLLSPFLVRFLPLPKAVL
jgi:hypothetical protein